MFEAGVRIGAQIVEHAGERRRERARERDIDVAAGERAGGDRDRQRRVRPDAEQAGGPGFDGDRSEEHTSELQSLMRTSYAVFCLKKKHPQQHTTVSMTSSMTT